MDNIDFFFGIENNYENITKKVYEKCVIMSEIYIPNNKSQLFGDNHPCVVKKLELILNNEKYTYDEYDVILINENEIIKFINNSNVLICFNYHTKQTKTKIINTVPFPISFSIPSEKIIENVCDKEKIMAFIVPYKSETYIYKKEADYYKDYQISFYGTTMLKAGYDCLRHYEILANGCIPYFVKLENIPEKTMVNFPKDIIKKSNAIYELNKDNPLNEETKKELMNISKELLNYTKNNLTTEECAKYILKKTNHLNAKKILFLSGDVRIDYLRCMTLHGFKKIFGSNCHDYPIVPHLYKNIKNNSRFNNLMTCSKLLDINDRDFSYDYDIEGFIKQRHFDLIIYGSYHRGLPFLSLIDKYYSPNKIVMLCGEDLHICDKLQYFNMKGYNTFIREM